MYGVYEEAGTSNISGGQWFFRGELLEYLESVSAGYLIKVKTKNPVGLLEGQKWEAVEGNAGMGASRFLSSMLRVELCKTLCGSKTIDEDRKRVVSYTRV